MEERALRVLKQYWGYESFRPAQEIPVMELIQNRDVLAIMPTGAGKSICFQVPALLKEGLTIVFSPLISLMQDQVQGLRLQNIPAIYLNSTLTQEEMNRALYYMREGRVKIVYLAPERLGSSYFCEVLRQMPISQIIVDEAHCVSQWGHDFRPAYTLIGPFIESLPKRPTVGAFTASATVEVERDMKALLGLESAKVHVTGFDRPNLQFAVVHSQKRLDYVIRYVLNNKDKVGIIYCSTRKDVEKVYGELLQRGIPVGYYHGGLPDEVRRRQQEYYAYDKVSVMVATNAFGMGIDKSNVRYVLHYQMPANMESYYQEAGRAGRDGLPAQCILLYHSRDEFVHKYLIDQSVEDEKRKRIELAKLRSMVDYAFTGGCLRKAMLAYFGEHVTWEKCHNCSNCLGVQSSQDMTEEAKALCEVVRSTGSHYGATFIAQIAKGIMNERIRKYSFDRLEVFGILRNYDEKDIKSLLRQLVLSGYLVSTGGEYPVLQLTGNGRRLLAGFGKVESRMAPSGPSLVPGERTTNRKPGLTPRGPSGTDSLFEHLRRHRRYLSEKEGVPPYLIVSDTVLIDMASAKPKTMADLPHIKGLGQAKIERYGLSFLQSIHDYMKKHR